MTIEFMQFCNTIYEGILNDEIRITDENGKDAELTLGDFALQFAIGKYVDEKKLTYPCDIPLFEIPVAIGKYCGEDVLEKYFSE